MGAHCYGAANVGLLTVGIMRGPEKQSELVLRAQREFAHLVLGVSPGPGSPMGSRESSRGEGGEEE